MSKADHGTHGDIPGQTVVCGGPGICLTCSTAQAAANARDGLRNPEVVFEHVLALGRDYQPSKSLEFFVMNIKQAQFWLSQSVLKLDSPSRNRPDSSVRWSPSQDHK